MAPITPWKPATVISRGNVSVGLAPAVADLNTPKVTEFTATGTYGLECAIQNFNATSSTDSETIDWLCDPTSETVPGSTSHEMDDLVIKTNGQVGDSAFITALKIGQKVYIWRRDGKATSDALAVGDMVWVWEVMITSIDPLEANNIFVGVSCHITVLRRTAVPVAMVA